MGKRENFTAGRVASFECEPGKQQTIHWDGKTPGLGLRVTATGAKSYIFESRLNGKTLRITIGDLRTWTVGAAQAEARRLKAQVDQGIDPREQRAEQKAVQEARRVEAKRQDVTVGDAWAAYLVARTPKWSDRHLLDHTNAIKPGYPLHALQGVPLAQLDKARVGDWARQEASRRPTQTALAFRLLRAFLNWCHDTAAYQGVAHADACSTRLARDALPKAKPKTDCLQREQLAPWFHAVRTIANPVISAYLQALLLTGARREELAGLRWADVDFQWKSLTIRDKVEGERTIPLTPYVAALLAQLPRRNEWVFSSPTAASGRLQEPRIQHNRALGVAGLPALTLHGLRRSFGTLAEWVECPAGISAQIMGHKPSAIAEKHYRARPLDLLRQWHTKIEGWILAQAGIDQPRESAPGLRAVK